jgi:voltage-gated potassium channel
MSTIAEPPTDLPRMLRRYQRGSLTQFIACHETRWELTMGAITAVYVALAIASDNGVHVPLWLVLAFTPVYLAEFTARCWDCPHHLRYAENHWLDIVACIPLVGALRGLRLLRLVRLATGLRVGYLMENFVRKSGRQNLRFLGPILVIWWTASAYAVWTVEHAINPHLRTFAQALYWSFITTTTFGYGAVKPITPEGRILLGLLSFVGVGLVGLGSSQITAWLLHDQKSGGLSSEEVERLRADIHRLEGLLLQMAGHPATSEHHSVAVPAQAQE